MNIFYGRFSPFLWQVSFSSGRFYISIVIVGMFSNSGRFLSNLAAVLQNLPVF
jgi:hypothetical protein